MQHNFQRAVWLTLVLAAGLNTAWAGNPHGDHGSHHKKKKGHHEHAAPVQVVPVPVGAYFKDDHRQAARAYYEPRWAAGKCPPGLAKKGNGCMPPGQAKHWHRGEPLPRDVVYYPVPTTVQVRLGTPPAGHKYVRIANDILLIAIGTSMVIDAIEDLGRL